MTITFENDSEVIIYGLEKIISFARENEYLFVANCAWWIAGVIGLDSELTIHIDNLHTRRQVNLREPASAPETLLRSVSQTPRDIARSVSVDQDSNIPEEELLAVTRRKNQRSRRNRRTSMINRVQKPSKKQSRKTGQNKFKEIN
jgi:hypothetical protein